MDLTHQQTDYINRAEFRIGQVLAQTLRALVASPLISLFVISVPAVILALSNHLITPYTLPSVDRTTVLLTLFVANTALYGLVYVFFQGVMLHASLQTLTGRSSTFAGALSQSFRHLPALVVAAVPSTIFGVSSVFRSVAPSALIPLAILMILAFFSLLGLAVAGPACIAENTTGIRALERSVELTRGRRLKIFGLYIVLGILFACVTFVTGFVPSFIESFLRSSMNVTLPYVWEIRYAFTLAGVFITMLVRTACLAALYCGLRTSAEGPMLDPVSQIFE